MPSWIMTQIMCAQTCSLLEEYTAIKERPVSAFRAKKISSDKIMSLGCWPKSYLSSEGSVVLKSQTRLLSVAGA